MLPLCYYDPAFLNILAERVKALAHKNPIHSIGVRLTGSETQPGSRVWRTPAEFKAEYEQILRTVPVSLLSRTVSPERCWGCHMHTPKTQICSRCRLARYCSEACRETAWEECHRHECDAFQQLSMGIRRRFEKACNLSDVTYADVLLSLLRARFVAVWEIGGGDAL